MASKKNNNKKTSNKSAQKKQAQPESFFTSTLFLHGLIMAVVFMFSAMFMYVSTDALIARAMRSALGGLFGAAAYMVPALFGGAFIYLIYSRSVKRMWIKFVLCTLELTDLSAMIGLFADYDHTLAYERGSDYLMGGGFVGVGIAENISELIGSVTSFLVLLIIFITVACFITHINIIPYLVRGTKMLLGYSADAAKSVKKKSADYAQKRREAAEAKEEQKLIIDDEPYESREPHIKYERPEEDELPMSLGERTRRKRETFGGKVTNIDIANDFAADIEAGAMDKRDLFGEELTGEKFDLYNMDFSGEDTDNEPAEMNLEEDSPEAEPEATPDNDLLAGMQVNEMKEQPKAENLTETEKLSFHERLSSALNTGKVDYRFPTLDLLDKAEHVSKDKRQELYKKAEQLIAVLGNFGVKAKPVQVTQGPTVTRYEIQPSSGTKLSKIVNLADDIAMNLAVSTVLIAPVPGKAATVGVEIPNRSVTPVKIREMLESPEFRNAKSKLTVCLGKDIGGNVVVGDIAKWPHALIAGATGSGKSVCINTIITSLLYKADPNEVKLIMVDPKQVELGVYNGIPHLLIPVVTEAKKAAGALNWAVSEMMQRYDLFKNSGVRKLEMYNKLMEKTGGEKLPQIVIIIDELADLMMVAAKEVEDYVCRLAQLARAAGIHLIIATQRPSVDVITGLIKANIPSRIAFFVSSQVDSRTILDRAGAEKLLGMGDMLYYPTGARSTTRVQGAFVSDGEVERIVDYIKSASPETHYSEDLEEHIERIALGENGVTPDTEEDGDALLPDAIKLAVELGKISTSMVQRRLGVGYARAGRIIDQMEARGIISPANGSKPRDVLVSHADMPFDDIEAAEGI